MVIIDQDQIRLAREVIEEAARIMGVSHDEVEQDRMVEAVMLALQSGEADQRSLLEIAMGACTEVGGAPISPPRTVAPKPVPQRLEPDRKRS